MTTNTPMTSKPISSPESPILALGCLGCLALLVLGVALAGLFLYNPLLHYFAARDWTPTPCVVTEHRVETYNARARSGRIPRPDLFIRYRYEFAGKTYESTEIDCLGDRVQLARGQTQSNRFPLGASLTCYVNPRHPAEAMLQRDFRSYYVLHFCVMLIMFLFGLACLIVMTLAGRRYFYGWFDAPPRAPGSPPPTRDDRLKVPGLPTALSRRNSQGLYTLTAGLSPIGMFAILLVVAGSFTFCLAALFIAALPRSTQSPANPVSPSTVMAVVASIPFALLAWRLWRASLTPEARLWVDSASLQPGKSARLVYEFPARTRHMQKWLIRLTGKEVCITSEEARTEHGAWESSEFFSDMIVSCPKKNLEHSLKGSVAFAIPAGGMHSFTSDHHKIQWSIVVEIQAGQFWTHRAEYILPVLPSAGRKLGAE